MDRMVEVTLPVDAEAAKALENPARREAAGRYRLLKGDRLRDALAEVIADAKQEARASRLTDETIDAELEARRAPLRQASHDALADGPVLPRLRAGPR
jgi:pyruvate/2-oxoglutarate dehydrogenase complex dihydrolipoamide acyltransferase (E2) component